MSLSLILNVNFISHHWKYPSHLIQVYRGHLNFKKNSYIIFFYFQIPSLRSLRCTPQQWRNSMWWMEAWPSTLPTHSFSDPRERWTWFSLLISVPGPAILPSHSRSLPIKSQFKEKRDQLFLILLTLTLNLLESNIECSKDFKIFFCNMWCLYMSDHYNSTLWKIWFHFFRRLC